MFFSMIASKSGMFDSCALIVCEKKQYVFPGMSASTGTCFTPNMTLASLISSRIIAPASTYDLNRYEKQKEETKKQMKKTTQILDWLFLLASLCLWFNMTSYYHRFCYCAFFLLYFRLSRTITDVNSSIFCTAVST